MKSDFCISQWARFLNESNVDAILDDQDVVSEDVSEKFEVDNVYRAPWDEDWFCRVISRTPTSIKVAIRNKDQEDWGSSEEQVTLRINRRKSVEQDCEVATGYDWEFWASERV